MASEKIIIFDSFRLDLANECLWQGSQAIKLRPKAFAVLDYLVGHSGQLVTKDDLLKAVWPETFVGDAVLKVIVGQLREALGDDPKAPRFIETAHRRGYRFIGQIAESGHLATTIPVAIDRSIPTSHLITTDSVPTVVEREEALAQMGRWLDEMLEGKRQIVFVTGEAGIGKSALVDTFARMFTADRRIRSTRGQCLEQYGTSEAYLPVLEAIGRLCRDEPQVADVLRTQAPMWLLQMPSLLSASEREVLSRETSGSTTERMLRELAEALEVLTANVPLVLILEDLHWSDYSTLDLISYLARQRQPAHLMVIGTYRPAELIVSGHPLSAVKRELLAKQECEELALEYLSKEAIGRYLSERFPNNRFPRTLPGFIHERTEGNPLFMVNVIDYLVKERLIVDSELGSELTEIEKIEVGVPDSIKQMIEKQIDRLDADQQRTLEAASVAGAEFSTVTVTAGLGQERSTVEAHCDELARQHQFIQDRGIQELPNGEAVTAYGFIHSLYRSVLYERVSASRRVQLHRRIGERAEEIYGDRAREIAAELAMHFERGRDYRRAAKYLQQAAENDIRRFAYQDAVELARRGLELLAKLPVDATRLEQELSLQLTLGVPLIATEGYASPEVGNVYLKARELCHQLGGPADVSEVLWGLRTYHTLRAEFEIAREIAEEFLRLAERLPYPGLAVRGHWAMEIIFLHLGEFGLAIDHYEKALSLYDPRQHVDDAFLYAQNPGVAMRCFAAWGLWLLGQPDQALQRIREALTQARELAEPNGLAQALFFDAVLHQLRREEVKAQASAEAAIAITREHGLVLYHAMATAARGWALIQQDQSEEGIEQMGEGLAAHRLTGAEVILPHFLALLAESFAKTSHVEEGLRLLEEALGVAQRNGDRYYEAELYRLKGELLLLQPGRAVDSALADAETCFRQAIDISQRQKAKSWELRAAMSMFRLLQKRGRSEEARSHLTKVYGSFTEGFDTMDLREAKELLGLS